MEQRRKSLMSRQPGWGDTLRSPNNHQSRPPITDAPINTLDAQDERDNLIMNQPCLKPLTVNADPVPSCQGWSLESLLSQGKNFEPIPRVSWSPTETTAAQIRRHDKANPGVPLVVDGLHRHPQWMKDKFTPAWFERHGPPEISVRNVHNRLDKDVGLSEFLAYARDAAPFATAGETERLYGKDVPCPEEWNKFLHNEQVIPAYLAPDNPENLLNALPPSDRIETLMCYLGIGDTFTPCHKDLCASSGHNLMVFTQGGSSFWFMTATSSAHAAAEYFSKKLGHELDHENHVVTIEEFAKAPFKVYITEQKLGDLVLVPPRSCHQVVNAGGLTIKTSWSRMTLDGLSLALRYELPLYRRVCRGETYRVKCTIYHALLQTTNKVSGLLRKQAGDDVGGRTTSKEQAMPTLLSKLRRLIDLFDTIIVEEYSSTCGKMTVIPLALGETDVSQFTCDFCGSDIFQSFFECRSCVEGERAAPGSGLVICPGCYVEGRTCCCEVMVPMQRRSFDELLKHRGHAADLFKACSDLQRKKSQLPVLPSNEKLLESGGKIGIFRAAIHLRRIRKEANDLKRCTTFRDHQHDTQRAWALRCQQCHHTTCFAHLVSERHLHSAEALLAHRKDENKHFHQCHRNSQQKYISQAAALSAEDPNQAPNLGAQLAYLADTFTTCRPIGYSKYRKAGFYDLTVWENESPSHTESTMAPAKIRRMDAKAAASALKTTTLPEPAVSSKPKRQVMDYIEVPIYRPPKRKERPVESTVPEAQEIESPSPPKKLKQTHLKGPPGARESTVHFRDEIQEIESPPPQKKFKQTHPKGPPGRRNPPSTIVSSKEARPAKKKNVIDVSDDSDSDDRPLKKPRPTPRSIKDLHFMRTKQAADSVADAFNDASAQNDVSVPSGSSVRLTPLPLPQKSGKRRARPETTPPSSSASPDGRLDDNAVADVLEQVGELHRRQQENLDALRRDLPQGSSSLAPLPPRRDERRASSSVGQNARSGNPLDELQRQLREVKEMQVQQEAEMNRLRQAQHPNVREPLETSSDSVNRLVGLVSSLVSTVLPTIQAPSTSEQRPRAPWSTSHRSMRGRSGSFGESSRRVYPPAVHYYGTSRGRQYYDAPSGSYGPGRYTDKDYRDRTWQPGPYANDERRPPAPFESRSRYHMDQEPESPPSPPQGKRRSNTRFSPPSFENQLALVPCRPGPRVEGQESGNEATVTNPEAPATNMDVVFRTPPPPIKPLFRTTLSSDAPPDEQDWEARYANGDS